MTDQLLFTIDGKIVAARPGETIWQVAHREGIDIPHLCWLPEPGYRADGNCRACMVEVDGERVLAASCIRKPAPDMVVKTATDRAKKARADVVGGRGRRSLGRGWRSLGAVPAVCKPWPDRGR